MTERAHPHFIVTARTFTGAQRPNSKDDLMIANIQAPKSLRRHLTAPIATAAIALIALTGCASDAVPETGAPGTVASDPSSEQPGIVTIVDPWVKSTDGGMTSAFGVIENPGDTDLVIVSATTDAAGDVELHETVTDASGGTSMQEVDAGFTIPAGGSHALEPGGDHLMLMEVDETLLAGEEIEITLTFETGETLTYTAVVKDYSGANEEYGEHDDHGEHAHDGHGESA